MTRQFRFKGLLTRRQRDESYEDGDQWEWKRKTFPKRPPYKTKPKPQPQPEATWNP